MSGVSSATLGLGIGIAPIQPNVPVRQKTEIIETADISFVRTFVTDRSLCVFDLDGTLIKRCSPLSYEMMLVDLASLDLLDELKKRKIPHIGLGRAKY